jgi:hypothetical protein
MLHPITFTVTFLFAHQLMILLGRCSPEGSIWDDGSKTNVSAFSQSSPRGHQLRSRRHAVQGRVWEGEIGGEYCLEFVNRSGFWQNMNQNSEVVHHHNLQHGEPNSPLSPNTPNSPNMADLPAKMAKASLEDVTKTKLPAPAQREFRWMAWRRLYLCTRKSVRLPALLSFFLDIMLCELCE